MQNSVIDAAEAWSSAFPNKFKFDEVVNERFIDTWAIALQLLGATEEEILTATAISVTKKWAPSSPHDFIALVRGRDSNSPLSHFEAYTAAANGDYPHVTVYAAAERFGFYELRREAQYTAAKKFKAIYEEVCEEYAADSSQFDRQVRQIERNKDNEPLVLESNSISLESQSAIAAAALAKLGL